MELDRDCCPFVIKVAWEPETQSSLTLPVTGRHRSVFLMRQDYPQIIINYYLASSKNINNQYLSFPLFSASTGFLVYRFPDIRNMDPLFMSIWQFWLYVSCLLKTSHWSTKGVPILWLVVSVTLCYVDLCLILIFSWPRINKQTQREYLKTVTEFTSEASLSFSLLTNL